MSKEIVAPMPGTIINILVNVGDEILEYQEVLILEAMKMENNIVAEKEGTVSAVHVSKDQKVLENELMIELE